jgi:nucleoside-triphosphatase THEP1
MMIKRTIREVMKVVMNWVKENKSIFVALLILMVCYGLMDTFVAVIDKTLLCIFSITRNAWLDWAFVMFTIIAGCEIWFSWIRKKKIVAARDVALILVPVVLYTYFRFVTDSPYDFTSYWNGPINYLDGFSVIGIVIVGLFVYQQLRMPSDETIDNKYSFGLDTPIKKADKDLFNMGSLVKRIVNYIAFTDVSDSASSIGIVGEWGDGKSSLMNLVEEKIKEEHKNFIIVHFNPRSSKKADFIQEDFLESLKQALSPKHSGIDRTIDKYAVALDVLPGVPSIVSKGLDLLQIRTGKKREIKRGELLKAIKDINCRIVVLIDDLDRLTGEELVEVLKVLDVNGAFPKMVFLTSFDKNYVNTVLRDYLSLGNQTRPYTDKYFTVEIRVPLHPSFRLIDYLVKLLTDASKSGFIKKKASEVEEMTRNLANFIMPRLRTIRDIKRFTNQFLYDYAEVQRDVSYRDYLLLELIKYSHPDDYEALYRLQYIHRGKKSFLSPSSDDLFYLSEKLLPKKKKSGDGMDEPEIKPASWDILTNLFPEESAYRNWYAGRYQRIYCVSSFEHYFYNYEYNHLKAEDFENLFNVKSIENVCKLIDDWMEFSKDLETYLLTRDVNSIRSKNVLRRFMQILLYAAHKHQSINYIGQNYCFLRQDDVSKIIENCGFSSQQEYVAWFKESMDELTAIEPLIPSIYLRTPISELLSNHLDQDFFVMTQQELQEYALELLNNYLAKVGTEKWFVSTAYYMAQIQNDAEGGLLPEASKALHDSMVANFGIYSASLPFFAENDNGAMSGYNIQLRFRSVFKDPEDFERLIKAKENDEASEVEMIRAIWPIFKANDCCNFNLPSGLSVDEAKKTKLKMVLDELVRYDVINKKMDELASEWNDKKGVDVVDSFVDRANNIMTDLNSISLDLRLRETYLLQLRDMINELKEYKGLASKEG